MAVELVTMLPIDTIMIVRMLIMPVIVIMLIVNSTPVLVFSYNATRTSQQSNESCQTDDYSHAKTCHPINTRP